VARCWTAWHQQVHVADYLGGTKILVHVAKFEREAKFEIALAAHPK